METGIELDESIGAAPSTQKAKIQIGSCVGVLYICNASVNHPEFCFSCGKTYCVHNGRLVKSTSEYVLINHSYVGKNGTAYEETRKFYKKKYYPRIVEMRLTPDLSPNDPHYYAQDRKPSKTKIVPHDCVAIEFVDNSKPYNRDIKNGRFLYWEDFNHHIHCTLTQPEPNLFRVYYYHFPKPACVKGQKPKLKGEVTHKDFVKHVYALTDKDLGAIAKC